MFDIDKSGSISTVELGKVMEKLKIKVNEKELNYLMKMMDNDQSGSIELAEFIKVMGEQFYKEPTKAELEAAFDYFDKG